MGVYRVGVLYGDLEKNMGGRGQVLIPVFKIRNVLSEVTNNVFLRGVVTLIDRPFFTVPNFGFPTVKRIFFTDTVSGV